MFNIFAVFFGGGVGAVMRYLSGLYIEHFIKTNLPLATFMVNITGCFALGFLYIILMQKADLNPSTKLALTVGFCGGFTTFSTFSMELFKMLQNNQFVLATVYILASVILGILAVYLGGYCAKFL